MLIDYARLLYLFQEKEGAWQLYLSMQKRYYSGPIVDICKRHYEALAAKYESFLGAITDDS